MKPTERYTFEQIAELAQDKERHHLELKNSTFVVIDHPLPEKRGENRDKSTLISATKSMLASECGAFANSYGGTLVIGYNDDGSLDPTPVPEKFEQSNTRIEQWPESLLKDCLEPPLEKFDCYTLVSNSGERIAVIDIPVSDKAPHQSTVDLLYYTRQGTSAKPADHWLIEAIRNRRIHSKLEAVFDLIEAFPPDISVPLVSCSLAIPPSEAADTATGNRLGGAYAQAASVPVATPRCGLFVFGTGSYPSALTQPNHARSALARSSSAAGAHEA